MQLELIWSGTRIEKRVNDVLFEDLNACLLFPKVSDNLVVILSVGKFFWAQGLFELRGLIEVLRLSIACEYFFYTPPNSPLSPVYRASTYLA